MPREFGWQPRRQESDRKPNGRSPLEGHWLNKGRYDGIGRSSIQSLQTLRLFRRGDRYAPHWCTALSSDVLKKGRIHRFQANFSRLMAARVFERPATRRHDDNEPGRDRAGVIRMNRRRHRCQVKLRHHSLGFTSWRTRVMKGCQCPR